MSKMPVDIGKIVKSVGQVGEERGLPVNVDLVFDPTADEALVDVMLGAFIDVETDARVEPIVMSGDAVPDLPVPCDLAVIVGGESLVLGDVAKASRAKGTPTVVAVARGRTYFSDEKPEDAAPVEKPVSAEAAGATSSGGSSSEASGRESAASSACGASGAGVPLDDIVDVDVSGEEKHPLDGLGEWIVRKAPAKRLSMAEDFPFLRRPLSLELARENAIQNGAIGLVFFVPGADMPIITANQARMVLQIGSVYGYAPGKERIREIVAVVAGGFGLRGVARGLVRAVPGLSWAIKPAVAASGTMAMAHAAIAYFEDPENVKRVDDAVEGVVGIVGDVAGAAADLVKGASQGASEPAQAPSAGASASAEAGSDASEETRTA